MRLQQVKLALLFFIASQVNAYNISKKTLFPTLPNVVQNSGNTFCDEHSRLMIQQLENHTLWAHEMWDASAKSSTGVLRGSKFQMGDWSQCMTIKGPFSTQYCLATVTASVKEPYPPRDPLSLHFGSHDSVFDKLYKTSDISQASRNIIQVGLCIPSSCSPQDLEHSLQKYIDTMENPFAEENVTYSVKVAPNLCHSQEPEKLDTLAIIFCTLVGVIVLLVLSSTIYDNYMVKEKQDQKWKAFRVFSAVKNFQQFAKSEKHTSDLQLLHGIKTICIFAIIIGHRSIMTLIGPVMNFDLVEEYYRPDSSSWIILRADMFVNTFFVISGLLLTFGLLTKLKEISINPAFLILIRYLRLTPLYAFVIFYYIAALPNLGSGPLWKAIIDNDRDDCKANWWTNILYINNYVRDDHICLIHSWYLPCEFHFFIIGTLLVTTMHKYKKLGLALLTTLLILSILVPFLVVLIYELQPILFFYPTHFMAPKQDPNFRFTYIKSHMRATPYFIGIIAGYIFFKYDNTKKRMSRVLSHTVTGISLALLTACMASGSIFYDPYHKYNALESAVLASVQYGAWALAVMGLIVTTVYGHATLLRSILSWYIWLPLSRISYAAYLIHVQFQYISTSMLVSPIIISPYTMLYIGVADIIFGYFAALLLYLTIEAPVKGLMVLMFAPKSIVKKNEPICDNNEEINRL